tara:strand:- start:24914 stop:25366 length:453 start_codon:yes stop_codon:yes gene_type:complete
MNHFLIQSVVKSNPQMRYTKDNQTAIAEMLVTFKGLRNDDPSSDLKVLGWGIIAQEMMDQLKEGQQVVLEGRLRMNSITRKDGTKEKQAELTASKIHHITSLDNQPNINTEISSSDQNKINVENNSQSSTQSSSKWNSSPLVPEVDEIPF